MASKTLKLKLILKKNPAVDAAKFAEAIKVIGELRARGLREPAYTLPSPFVRTVMPVDPRVKPRQVEQPTTGTPAHTQTKDPYLRVDS